FAAPQIATLIELAHEILERHPIPPERVLGHSDVAPNRKEDPGELFPWKALADFGIGRWPDASADLSNSFPRTEDGFASALSRFGYGVPREIDWPLADVVRAFQRHFRPSCINGIADPECADILDALLPLAE